MFSTEIIFEQLPYSDGLVDFDFGNLTEKWVEHKISKSIFSNFGPFLLIFQSFKEPFVHSTLKNKYKWPIIGENRKMNVLNLHSTRYSMEHPKT